ncbi:MAG: ferredoxin [Acidimicrobiia bacterium]
MHVWIDQRTCVGNGICEEICPELFDFDGNLAYVRGPGGERLPGTGDAAVAAIPDDLLDAVYESAEECPAGCIHVVE